MTATPNFFAETPDGGALIEEALRMVRLSSAVFLRGEFTEPWAVTSLDAREYSAVLCPGADSLVLFHIVVEGRCSVWLESGEEVSLGPGEAVVLPYCDRHSMGYPRDTKPVAMASLVSSSAWRALPIVRQGDPASSTLILCGYLRCEDFLFQPMLKALPPVIHVRPATRSGAEWIRASARYALEQFSSPRAASLGQRLSELLLVECLRQYVAALPAPRAGWLAALRDPVIGRALQFLHASPSEGWTVSRLARKLAVSRTVLAERFTSVLRQPPMRYLAQWRLQVAAHLLRTTDEKLPEIAARVGYTSEAAFSRAFKRGVGAPPAVWRTKSRAA